jgi:quercetin dioxygenase-like cupin family protein
MTEQRDDATPWEPDPISAEDFHQDDSWANVNRAPYDEVGGVLFKRAANIKRVRYSPANPAPEMPEAFQGSGDTVVRWLFSELSGTAEGLLDGATFAYLHDVTIDPDAAAGMQPADVETILYVITGEGVLHHRPTPGSPVLTRPLRPGDAALVHAGEYHRVAADAGEALRLIVLGLRSA